MNCDQVLNCLTALERAHLSASERTALEEHLAVCPACAQTARLERQLDRELDDLFGPMDQAAATHQLEGSRILAANRTHRAFIWMARTAVAAVFVVSLTLAVFWRSGGNGSIRDVLLDSPVRQASIASPLMRIPEIREQTQLAVDVSRLRDNIIWVSIRN